MVKKNQKSNLLQLGVKTLERQQNHRLTATRKTLVLKKKGPRSLWM